MLGDVNDVNRGYVTLHEAEVAAVTPTEWQKRTPGGSGTIDCTQNRA